MIQEDSKFINDLKKGKNLSFSIDNLHKIHAGIFYKVLHQYIPDRSDPLILNIKRDIINEIKYHIYIAALDFDYSKGVKFSTYLGNRVRWMCLNKINKLKSTPEIPVSFISNLGVKDKEAGSESLHGLNFNHSFVNDFSKREYFEEIFNSIFKQKDPRVKEIFNMRYNEGKNNKLTSWKKISKKMNLSIQGCINIHNTFLKKIKPQKYDK